MSDRVAMLAETAQLVDACREVGLIPARMQPYPCHGKTCWTVALWTPPGGLWMEASHERSLSVLDAVTLWREKTEREAREAEAVGS